MRLWNRHHPGHGHHGGHAMHDGFGRHRHDGDHGGRGGGRGREARLFEHGDLRLVIVALLAEKPRYGYDIIKGAGGTPSAAATAPAPGWCIRPSPCFEEMGHAVVSEERAGRKLYTLASDGVAFFEANRPAASAVLARIDAGAVTPARPALPGGARPGKPADGGAPAAEGPGRHGGANPHHCRHDRRRRPRGRGGLRRQSAL